MLVRLHVNGEIAFGRGGIIADVASVGFVAAGVSLSSSELWVLLARDAVHAGRVVFRMFFLHVNLQGLLILIVPVAFRALERFAAVSRMLQHRHSGRGRRGGGRQTGARRRSRRGGAHNHITFGTVDAGRLPVRMRGATERRQTGNLTGSQRRRDADSDRRRRGRGRAAGDAGSRRGGG